MLRLMLTACTVTLATGVLAACGASVPGVASAGGDGVVTSKSRPVLEQAVGRDSIVLPAEPGEPCWGAERHSLSDLAALADVPVWLPQSSSASEATLTGAWTCGADTPFLTFGAITVSYESGYRTPLPWARKASDSGGELRTILGQTGLLMPSTSPTVKGEVMVVVDDGVLVRVLGEPDVPPEELVAVADSIRLDEPVKP